MQEEKAKLERKLIRAAALAVRDFDLVGEGDRIMVAVSGGKDSLTLLHVLLRLRERAPVHFDLLAVNLDQGHPGFPVEVVEDHLRAVGVPYRMIRRDTYSVVRRVVPLGKSTCAACSRFRRGVLYDAAVELRCNKIALGHHRDDLVETLLLNAFYSGTLKAMPAKLRARDGRNVVIRPLCYADEGDIAAFATAMRFPVVPCGLCGSQPNLRRKRVKALLAELSAEHPAVKGNLLSALSRVVPSHLLDRDLQRALSATSGEDPWLDEGDDLDPGSPRELPVIPGPGEASERPNSRPGREP